MHVALLAYACKSGDGSEPGAGFLWALASSQVAQVTLITRPLDSATRTELLKAGVTVHELDIVHSPAVPQLSYIRWVMKAQSQLTELHRLRPIDLVHHVTYATDWLPAPSLKDVPLIWGPVGGSTNFPRELHKHFSRKLRLKEECRNLITGGVRQVTKIWAKKRVSTLIAQNQDTARNYGGVARIYVHPNYIVDERPECATVKTGRTIAMVGRLIEMKGVHLAIAAMRSAELSEWHLRVIGDGPMRQQLEKMAADIGVADRISFHGRLPRPEVYEHLRSATCSLLLSTHDAAGWAAAESIAVGTPVHTWSHGGPAELVLSTGCGSAIEPGDDAVSALASAIAQTGLYTAETMSSYSFDAVVADLEAWYEEVTK